jgi:Fe-S cluster biogenesis protein NfuA
VIRSAIKSSLKKVLGFPESAAPAPAAPAWRTDAPPYPSQHNTPAAETKPAATGSPAAETTPAVATEAPEAAAVEAAPVAVTAPVEAAPEADAAPEAPAAPADDVVGGALSLEAIQEVMDEMVRPALQGDGGDITLIKVENNDVYVKLVGSCSTCPSSIMTMRLGVEALLKEEFPAMGQLISVD